MAIIVLSIRFCLEMISLLGLFAGFFIGPQLVWKIASLLMGFAFFFLWYRFGAPKSPFRLLGWKKLVLEISLYSLVSLFFLVIYPSSWALAFATLACLDLLFYYLLGLGKY